MLEVLMALIVSTNPELQIPPNSTPIYYASEPLPSPIPQSLPLNSPVDESLPLNEGSIATDTPNSFLGLISTAFASDTPIYCSCVRTSRLFNKNLELKDAKDLVPNSEPVVGGQIQFYYPKSDTWHVATIERFSKEGFWVVEGNFAKCDKTRRLVYYGDPFIRGFIR